MMWKLIKKLPYIARWQEKRRVKAMKKLFIVKFRETYQTFHPWHGAYDDHKRRNEHRKYNNEKYNP